MKMSTPIIDEIDEVEKSESEVEIEVKVLQTGLDQLKDSIDVLERRLSAVLHPEVVPEVTDKPVNPLSLVPLASDLHNQSRRIDNLTSNINGILSRLEL